MNRRSAPPRCSTTARRLDEVGPWVAVLGPDADRAAHHLRPGDDGRLVLRAVGPGRAPSVGRSGDRRVIFDGQLHNAHDLARALAAPSGTPVADLVARAHERWGDASLQRLKGTFACAIWMAATGTLKLVRDPVGTYPFFFAESGGRIAFGVDAEPLLSLPWVSRALNRAAIADHLSHRWLVVARDALPGPVPRSSWQCRHLAGAALAGSSAYWYPVDPSGKVEWVHDDALDQFQEVFEQAIDRCLGQGRCGDFPQRWIRLGEHRRDGRGAESSSWQRQSARGVALLLGSVVQRGAHSEDRCRAAWLPTRLASGWTRRLDR